jgi:transcription elongation factor GreA
MARTKNNPIPISAAGLSALKAELSNLRDERRPSMVNRVATARQDGDLKENFAYHDARQELGMLDGRVQTIEGILRHAVVIEPAQKDGSIGLGSSVVVRDEFGDSRYTVVGPAEADIARGLISLGSPMGTALMGRRIGDKVTFQTPGGERNAMVIEVD